MSDRVINARNRVSGEERVMQRKMKGGASDKKKKSMYKELGGEGRMHKG